MDVPVFPRSIDSLLGYGSQWVSLVCLSEDTTTTLAFQQYSYLASHVSSNMAAVDTAFQSHLEKSPLADFASHAEAYVNCESSCHLNIKNTESGHSSPVPFDPKSHYWNRLQSVLMTHQLPEESLRTFGTADCYFRSSKDLLHRKRRAPFRIVSQNLIHQKLTQT